MYLKIPDNQITVNYTSGNEYVVADTQRTYQGYFYAYNDRTYAGKEFDINAPEIIKIEPNNVNLNPLLFQAASFIYGKISKSKLNNPISPQSFYFNPDTTNTNSITRYYLAKLNTRPLLIREVNQKTFDKYQSDPIYVSVSLLYQNSFNENELNEAEKKMPGIKLFVNSTYTPGATD